MRRSRSHYSEPRAPTGLDELAERARLRAAEGDRPGHPQREGHQGAHPDRGRRPRVQRGQRRARRLVHQWRRHDERRLQVEAIEALDAIPQPLIAAVNGVAYTGALELLLAADIVVAAKHATFCDTHAKLGLVPTWGLSVRMPHRIGLANAKITSFTSFTGA